jgi:hypothetical protein
MKILLLLLTIAHLLPVAADWQINTITDEMTDVTSYAISTAGTEVDTGMIVKYRPWLHFRITPVAFDREKNQMHYRPEVFFAIETEGLKRGSAEVAIRFDKRPAETVTVTTSTERRAGFFTPGLDYLDKALSATNVTIRYVTTLGSVRTSRFNVSGLQDQILSVKKLYSESLKKTVSQ